MKICHGTAWYTKGVQRDGAELGEGPVHGVLEEVQPIIYMLTAPHTEPTPLSIFPDGAVARQAIGNASLSFPIPTFEQNPGFYIAAC